MSLNPLDFPMEPDPEETSSDSSSAEDQDAQGADGTPEERGAASTDASVNDRINRLEREVRDRDGQMIDLLAKNTVLETRVKESEKADKEKFTPEQLKEFGLEKDGLQQFDAAAKYTDQVKDEILEQVRTEYREEKTTDFVREYMQEIYPDLKDENSDFSKKVSLEQARILGTGAVDPNRPDAASVSLNMALHRVGRTAGMEPETNEEHSTRRRLETSGAEGAPKGEKPSKPDNKLTNDERSRMVSMGLDPSKKSTVQVFKESQRRYANMRIS